MALAYADDVTVICSSAAEIHKVISQLQVFCDVSGASANFSKSYWAWLEASSHTLRKCFLEYCGPVSIDKHLVVSLWKFHFATGQDGVTLSNL